jgi:putative membrane protein
MLMTHEPDALRTAVAMGGMMGGTGTGAWIFLWITLGLAVMITAGVVVARALAARREPGAPQLPSAPSPAVREAQDAMKMRYARGEISREEYLQGKVELED